MRPTFGELSVGKTTFLRSDVEIIHSKNKKFWEETLILLNIYFLRRFTWLKKKQLMRQKNKCSYDMMIQNWSNNLFIKINWENNSSEGKFNCGLPYLKDLLLFCCIINFASVFSLVHFAHRFFNGFGLLWSECSNELI